MVRLSQIQRSVRYIRFIRRLWNDITDITLYNNNSQGIVCLHIYTLLRSVGKVLSIIMLVTASNIYLNVRTYVYELFY